MKIMEESGNDSEVALGQYGEPGKITLNTVRYQIGARKAESRLKHVEKIDMVCIGKQCMECNENGGVKQRRKTKEICWYKHKDSEEEQRLTRAVTMQCQGAWEKREDNLE